MKAFIKGLIHHHPSLFSDDMGGLVDNYLDDIWFLAQTEHKNTLQILIAEYWADQLGIELNHDKREVLKSSTRHLGFFIDLNEKVASITSRHKNKITGFFDEFLMIIRKKGRLFVKTLQGMLGLQIWISTVFRVARQFLTSLCELLRVVGTNKYIYPSQHKTLISRIIIDLKFWRRFVKSNPSSPFNALLGRLPTNSYQLSSDAATSWGMAGVLLFPPDHGHFHSNKGLFQQISWDEWYKVFPISALSVGSVKINVAEFLAILITCETFTTYCAGKMTTIETDNISAVAWFNKARCPVFPFDRCAQGLHLHILKHTAKLRASWIPSGLNTLADYCSRNHLYMGKTGHNINGTKLIKVRPRWSNVIRYLQ